MYFEDKARFSVWGISGAVGVTIMLLPLLLGLYVPQAPYLIPLSQKVNNTIVLGLLIVMIFPAVVEFHNYRWGRHVERNIPRLLRDVSEAVRAGVTLPKALEDSAQRNYGPISKELEHAISMFVLGASWEEAMMSLARRLKRPSALRLATIFIEANQTGGKMVEVLGASVNLFSSLDEFREEQYNNMKPYLLTIYMATVIFLIIAYVVLHQFLGPLYAATTAVVGTQESGLLPNILDINYYASILFWASVMEAVFGGLIAGKIGDRSLSAGMRHSAVLVATAVIFFNFAGA